MSSTATTHGSGHPIEVAAAQMHARLDALLHTPAWSLDAEQTRAVLTQLTTLAGRVAELELRVAAHAHTARVGDQHGHTGAAAWWAHATRQTRAEAHRKIRLAGDLASHEPVRTDLACGEILPDQAQVIVRAVDALPKEAEPWVKPDAEAELLRLAAEHDAKALRILGRQILHVVDPAHADAHEADLLEQEAAQARDKTRMQMRDDGHGLTRGTFAIPTEHAAMLRTALQAIMAPKHRTTHDGQAPVPGRPSDKRMGEAFCEYIENYPTDHLPHAGGTSASIVLTVDQAVVLEGLAKAGHLDTGERLAPSVARRLACRHGVLPAVMAGSSCVLDLGRRRRFHTPAQRLAMGIEQGGCRAEGCDWPPGMCHAHHPTPWSRLGETNKDGDLLCPRHHHLVHDPRYDHTRLPDGQIRFHRRQ